MTSEERAARYVVLFNHYGDKWRANVPVDAMVARNGTTVLIDGIRLDRGADGTWAITSPDVTS